MNCNPKMVANGNREESCKCMSKLYKDTTQHVKKKFSFSWYSPTGDMPISLNSRWFSQLPKNCWNVIFHPTVPLHPATQTNQTSTWPFRNVNVKILLQALARRHTDLFKKIWQYTVCWITEISSALPYVLNIQQTNFSYQYFVRVVWIVSIKLFFLLKRQQEESNKEWNKICKCSQALGSTKMLRISEMKPLILIWKIVWYMI